MKVFNLNLANRFILVLVALTLVISLNVSAQERLVLTDGSRIEYLLAMPENSDASSWPLAIFMGGGSGNKPISIEAFRFVGRELAQRGWAVAVPVSPDNASFRGANVAKIRELIVSLQSQSDIESGKVLLGGISNGGMSALEIARQNPEDYLGVMAVPAIVRDNARLESLKGMPVYLRIGGNDQLGWAMQFSDTVARLDEFGVNLDAAILEGAAHMFAMDWEQLDPWLQTIRP